MVELCLKVCRNSFLRMFLGVFAFTALADAQSASLVLGSAAGTPGSNVTVNLALSAGGSQAAALQWTLQYSSTDITGVSAAIGAAASSAGKSLTCTGATCVIFGFNQSVIADGLIAQLTFTIAPGTTSTSLPIQMTQVVLSDTSGGNIPVSVTVGSIAVVQPAAVVVSGLSCSLTTLSPSGKSTCVVTLNQPATGSGAAVALSSNNASVSVPASATVLAGAATTSFTATAGTFNTDGSAQITAALNGSTGSASLTLTALSQVSSLSCTPALLNPNGQSTCLVALSKAGPASGASIALSSNSASVSVPASVTVIGGATTTSFTATAGTFTTDGSAQINASLNGQSQAFALTLKALAQIQVTSITCNPATFNGGSSSTCKVTLSGAPSTNGSVTLSSNAANVTVPSSITIPSGQISAQFMAASTLLDVDTNAAVTASFGSSHQSTTLTLIGVRPTLLSCSPLTLSAGGSTKCTVQLNRAPQPKRITLQVSSGSTSIQVPQTLSTKPQQTQYSFTARAATFARPGTVLLSVAYLTSVASANIGILAPGAPALLAPTKMTTTVGTAVTVAAQADDLSGLNVSLSANNLPDGASFTVNNASTTLPATTVVSGAIRWVPKADQVGTYSFNFDAQSAAGTTSQKVIIQVASPVPQITGVLNAASLSTQQVCSPGSLAIIQGTGFQVPSPVNGNTASRISVNVNGVPTRILDVSPTQITFRCPENIKGQSFTLQVSNRFGASNSVAVAVQDAAPGIFTLDSSGTGQGVAYVNGGSNIAALPDPSFAGQPASPGDTLTLLMTGLPDGPVASSETSVTIGQITAEVLSVVDVPLSPGLKMLNVNVPQTVPVGDSIPVQVFSQGSNAQSNTATIAIALADR